MNYSFKRSSKLFLVKGGLGHGISALSNFTISQTITEKTLSRKNQFSSIAPKAVINRSKNLGTGSLEIYYTKNCPSLGLILESLDFANKYNSTFTFANIFSNTPKPLGLVVLDTLSGKSINIPQIYITNMDVQCSPNNITKFTFGFVFSESNEYPPQFMLNEAIVPEYPVPSFIDFCILDNRINSVKSAAFTITRNIRWLSDGANQFNLGEVTNSHNPVVTEYNITALATANDNLDSNMFKSLVPINSDVVIGNNAFFLALPKARITIRKEPSEVFTVNFDIKHQSLSPVLIGGTYNGYIN